MKGVKFGVSRHFGRALWDFPHYGYPLAEIGHIWDFWALSGEHVGVNVEGRGRGRRHISGALRRVLSSLLKELIPCFQSWLWHNWGIAPCLLLCFQSEPCQIFIIRSRMHDFLTLIAIFSCDQAALWMVFSVRLSVCLSVCPSVCPSVRLSHLFDYVPIIVSSWNFQELSHWTRVRSMQKVKVRGQRSRSQRSRPKFSFPDCNSSLNSHMMMKWYI